MKKKALLIATVGGFVTHFEWSNVRLLQEMGYEIYVASNYHDPVYPVEAKRLERAGIRLKQCDMAKSPYLWKENLKALQELGQWIKEEQFSLIHCHTPVGGVLGRLAGKIYGNEKIKVIYTAHGFHFYKGAPLWNKLVYYSVEKFLAGFTDALITINEEDYRNACKFHLKKNGKVYKIPGEGLEREYFWPGSSEEREKNRKRFGMAPEDFVILSVGELSGNKNHEYMIRLFPVIQRSFPNVSFRYYISGDGFFREKLENVVKEMKLQEKVKLLGYRSDIREVLMCADCFAFPSRREGLGMAALEAMCMRIPVIASDNRGTREYMKPGKNGFVWDLKKPEERIQALRKVLSLEKREKEKLLEEAKRTVELFTLENSRKAMKAIYREVLEEMESECSNAAVSISCEQGSCH